MDNTEYKIITSNTPMFSSTDNLKTILDQAGWDLVEKLDNYKIRLCRDKSARDSDDSCQIDPYRTTVGMNNFIYMGGAAVITLIVIYLIIKAAAMTV